MTAEIVLFLQNAWAHNARGAWPRELWLQALCRCHTGRRLRLVLGSDWDSVHIDNTTPAVGVGARSRLAPDPAHISAVLAAVQPRTVIACGKQAEDVILGLWPGRLLILPHPAYRIVTNALLRRAGDLVRSLEFWRTALRQGRGEIIQEDLATESGVEAGGLQ